MKIFGALVVLGFAAITFSGYEPFTTATRGAPPTAAKRGPGGTLLWFGGTSGGK